MSAYCERCDLPLDQCWHGLEESKKRKFANSVVQVSPNNVAHLEGCAHKGEDEDFTKWGEITTENAWKHLCQTMPLSGGVASDLVTNAGAVIGLQVTHVCKDCRAVI